MKSLLIYGLSTLVLSSVSVFIVRQLAYKYGWVDAPKKDRWHKEPRALFGGIGIFAAYFLSSLICLIRYSDSSVSLLPFIVLISGGSGSFLLGLIDDIYSIKPITKIVGQIIVSSLFIFFVGSFQVTQWQIVNVFITYFWFLGIINAINLLDNMDGLACGIVFICSFVFLCLSLILGHSLADIHVIINLIFLMSVLGFYFFNKNPASIFMGDAGSFFLGYNLAALPIILYTISLNNLYMGYSSVITLLIPATIMAIPIFDTTLVTITRKFSGRAVSKGGKDHSSHRLVGLGFSEKSSVYILYIFSLIGGLLGIFMTIYPKFALIIFAFCFIFLAFFGIYLSKKMY